VGGMSEAKRQLTQSLVQAAMCMAVAQGVYYAFARELMSWWFPFAGIVAPCLLIDWVRWHYNRRKLS